MFLETGGELLAGEASGQPALAVPFTELCCWFVLGSRSFGTLSFIFFYFLNSKQGL